MGTRIAWVFLLAASTLSLIVSGGALLQWAFGAASSTRGEALVGAYLVLLFSSPFLGLLYAFSEQDTEKLWPWSKHVGRAAVYVAATQFVLVVVLPFAAGA